MAKTAAAVLLDVLVAHGVEYVFGIPGDAVDPLMEPLRRDGRLKFVQVRHEEAGAFMASAVGKLTGGLGVALGTAGPGAIHLLNGLYDAKMDHAPVLALTGQVSTDYLGTDYFQEVDLLQLFNDVAAYNHQVTDPNQMAIMADNACRTALAKRAVAHLNLTFDALRGAVEQPVRHFGVRSAAPRDLSSVPADRDLARAADLIDRARRPVVLAGRGALGSRGPLERFAEAIQAPVVNTLPGKGVLRDQHPLALGGLGLLGAKPAHTAMEQCDLCVMVGTAYPYWDFLPKSAKLVQIDWEVSQIGKRVQVDAGLVGDAGPTLDALTARVRRRPDPTEFLTNLQHQRRAWMDWVAGMGKDDRIPLNPQRVVNVLSDLVDPDANVAVDVGNALVWMARGFFIRDQGWLVSAWLGSMGFGMPAAIAAQLVDPHHQAVAVVGDGGFAMLMADFVTAVKYRLPIKVVVLDNHRLAMIKFEQEVEGYPEFGTELTNPDFAAYAEACGARGIRVEHQDQLADALADALKHPGPVLVDVWCNPNERPLPPRITMDQARGYATALFRETFGL
jgi:pyruvate oxidase